MDNCWVTLTPGTTLRFGSLSFVYTGPVESVVGRTFGRPPCPNVLTRAAGHEAFVRDFSGDVIVGMLGTNPTQECFRLAAYYLTDLAFQASGDGPLGWGEFMERYTAMYPRGQPDLPDDPVTTYVNSPARPAQPLGLQPLGWHGPRDVTTPRGSATFAWPSHRASPNRSQLCTTAAPTTSGAHGSTRSQRQGAISMRSWPFHTESSVWKPSHASDNRHRACWCKAKPMRGIAIDARCRTFLCRANPVRRTTTGTNADQLQTSHVVMHLRRTRAPEPDNNRRANGGANDDTGAPPLFRRASQNLAAAAMLLRGFPEPATSEERRVREQLKAPLEAATTHQAESSASRQPSERGRAGAPSAHSPNPAPPQQQGHGDEVGAALAAVKS
jgi:hypothetical protein